MCKMSEEITTVRELKEKNIAFVKARGWDKRENPKDIVMALAVEAAELMEIFQFKTPGESEDVSNIPEEFEHMQEEIADVFLYLIRLCDHFDIDLAKAVEDKMAKNAMKYPVSL